MLMLIAGVTGELSQITVQLENLVGAPQSAQYLEVLETQRQAILRRATLQIQRDRISAESAAESGGVVVSSSANDLPVTVSGSPLRSLAIAALLGVTVGTAGCYWLALRNRQYSEAHQPESTLRSPLVAMIPTFRGRHRSERLPVLSAPHSTAAEGFRFAASAIDISMTRLRDDRPGRAVVVATASHSHGDGKSVLAANVAFALARGGLRVLIVDSDLDSPGVTDLLLGHAHTGSGLVEALAGDAPIDDCIGEVTSTDGSAVALMPSGSSSKSLSLWRSNTAESMIADLRLRFDVVIIDCPALTQVAYAAFATGFADLALAVVRHGSAWSGSEELADRLQFLDIPLLGYVYNHAPEDDRTAAPRGPSADNQAKTSLHGKSGEYDALAVVPVGAPDRTGASRRIASRMSRTTVAQAKGPQDPSPPVGDVN